MSMKNRIAELEQRLEDLEKAYARDIPVNLAPLIAVYDVRIGVVEDKIEAEEKARKERQKRLGQMSGRSRPGKKKK